MNTINIKKYGKHKAVSHLYKSGAIKDFQYMAKLNGRATKLLEMILLNSINFQCLKILRLGTGQN